MDWETAERKCLDNRRIVRYRVGQLMAFVVRIRLDIDCQRHNRRYRYRHCTSYGAWHRLTLVSQASPACHGCLFSFYDGWGGIAAMLSPLVAQHYGSWQSGLGIWLVLPVIALLLWWLRPYEKAETIHKIVSINFFSNRRAWLLASYFGLGGAGYACMIAWLPTYARSLGWSAQNSGELIGLMTVFQVIGALGAPALSSNRLDRRQWLFFAVGIQIIGFMGLLLMPKGMLILWVAMIGCGLGAFFSLTLTVALDHLSSASLAGALTAFVQGIGFIVSAIIPYIAGMFREWTGSFQASWLMLIVTLIGMLLVTIKFAPAGYAKAINLPNI